MLNKSKGNMYPFVTHTWNTVKGKCPHDCSYCYMKKRGKQPELHFDEKELRTDLGEGNFVFVGSSCDMWAKEISSAWICQTLDHCANYPQNKYLFQSKNPHRFANFHEIKPNIILGTTIETNRSYPEMGKTPFTDQRVIPMRDLSNIFKTMVTIEPIIDFDLVYLIDYVKWCSPQWVNIGANTNTKVKLPEPTPGKIKDLIAALSEFTEVKIKKNLNRLLL